MARSAMAELISLVRDLVGDAAGTTQLLTDDQVERGLDVHRWEHRYEALNALTTVTAGVTEYLDWVSETAYWESDAVLVDANYATLTPAASFPLQGRWTFTVSQTTVLISGQTYDPYGAAADLLEMLAARYVMDYDVSMDGASLARSQRPKALRELAMQYRRMQRPVSVRMVRGD